MNCVVPDIPADYVGRPPLPGKLVELLLAEESCRMWASFSSKNAADLGRAGRGRGWLLRAAARCWILLEGLATRLCLRRRLVAGLPDALGVVLGAVWTQTVTSLALSPGSERSAYT